MSTEHDARMAAAASMIDSSLGQFGRFATAGSAAYCNPTSPAMISVLAAATRSDPRLFLQHQQPVPNSWFDTATNFTNAFQKLSQTPNVQTSVNNTKNTSTNYSVSDTSISNHQSSQADIPSNISANPRLWTRSDVSSWLEWSEKEYSLTSLKTDSFAMNGKALCLLTKQDFRDRVPSAGDLLYNALQILLKNSSSFHATNLDLFNDVMKSISNNSDNKGNTNRNTFVPGKFLNDKGTDNGTSSPAPSSDSGNQSAANSPEYSTRANSRSPSIQTSRFTFSDECISDMEEDTYGDDDNHTISFLEPSTPPALPLTPSTPKSTSKNQMNSSLSQGDLVVNKDTLSSGRLLWDFLQQLLNDVEQRYKHCIVWKDRDLRIFKIVDPQALAKLWGIHKNHLNMNFDKMSRALRYYYRVNILRKEPGEKHCYRFLRHPAELRHCRQKALLNIPPKNIDNQNQKSSSIAPTLPLNNHSSSIEPHSQDKLPSTLEVHPSHSTMDLNRKSSMSTKEEAFDHGAPYMNNSQEEALNLRVKEEPNPS